MEVSAPKINSHMNSSAGALCDFEVRDAGAGGMLLRTLGAGETPQKILAESEAHKIKTSPATGFGPGAFFGAGDYGVIQLNAFKGSTHVIVQSTLFTMSPDKTKEAVGKLMTIALPRVK